MESGVGYAVAGVGDVNADGIDDLVVGAPDASPGEMENGTCNTAAGMAAAVYTKNNPLVRLPGTNARIILTLTSFVVVSLILAYLKEKSSDCAVYDGIDILA